MRVLVVDDEKLIAEDLKAEVKSLYSDALCDAATSADEAFELAEKSEYDVALLDIDLAGMDGLTLARKLISMQPSINIVFVTGHQEYSLEAHELYCSGFLLKPVGERKLKKAFENLRKPLIELSEDFYSQHYQGNDVLGNRIEKYREMRGLSRNDLADLMNVTRQTIHRWEHSERIPDVLTFVRLARVLGVEIGELLGINDEA